MCVTEGVVGQMEPLERNPALTRRPRNLRGTLPPTHANTDMSRAATLPHTDTHTHTDGNKRAYAVVSPTWSSRWEAPPH